jgi:hypothetical protein
VSDDGDDDASSLVDTIDKMVMLCADGNALVLKEVYTTWTYSETVFFAIKISRYKRDLSSELDGIKDPFTMMIMLLHQRLR